MKDLFEDSESELKNKYCENYKHPQCDRVSNEFLPLYGECNVAAKQYRDATNYFYLAAKGEKSQFKGIILSYSASAGNITLHWAKAVVDGDDASYKVYVRVRVGNGNEEWVEQAFDNGSACFWSSNNNKWKGKTVFCKVEAYIGEKIIENQKKRWVEVDVLGSDLEMHEGAKISTRDDVPMQSFERYIKDGVIANRVLLASLKKGDIVCTGWGSLKFESAPGSNDSGFKLRESLSLHREFLNITKDDGYENSLDIKAKSYLAFTFDFEPEFHTKAVFKEHWHGKSLQSVRMCAKGKFCLKLKAGLELDANSNIKFERSLFKRTATLQYVIGGVPVLQDVTLELIGKVEVTPEIAVNASAKVNIEEEVELGFHYDHYDKKITRIGSSSFKQEVLFDFKNNWKLSGMLTIYPVISTTFYKTAETSIDLIPSINMELEIEDILNDGIKLEKLDLIAKLDAGCSVALKIFSRELARKDWGPMSIWENKFFDKTKFGSSTELSRDVSRTYLKIK